MRNRTSRKTDKKKPSMCPDCSSSTCSKSNRYGWAGIMAKHKYRRQRCSSSGEKPDRGSNAFAASEVRADLVVCALEVTVRADCFPGRHLFPQFMPSIMPLFGLERNSLRAIQVLAWRTFCTGRASTAFGNCRCDSRITSPPLIHFILTAVAFLISAAALFASAALSKPMTAE